MLRNCLSFGYLGIGYLGIGVFSPIALV